MRRATILMAVVSLSVAVLPAAATDAAPAAPNVERLVKAARLAGSNGLVFDSSDRLYVGTVGGRSIIEMDPETGRILHRYGPDDGFEGADDVALGPDGAIYYTAILTGEVGRLNPDGTHETVTNLGLGVNPIAFSDDGRLFVGTAFFGDALYEVDPDGSSRLVNEGLGLNGFAWRDGYLYAPRMGAGEVVKIDVDTGEYEVVAGGLNFPHAVDFDPRGRLHVLGAVRLHRIDLSDGEKHLVAKVPGGSDNMAFDSSGRLFVSNNDDGSIIEVLRGGELRTVRSGGMLGPQGLAVTTGPRGHDVVFAAGMWYLWAFNGTTGRERLDTSTGYTAMTVSPAGESLVLTSWFDNVVYTWDQQTQEVETAYDDFAVPLNAIRFQGDLVVAELGTGQITRLNEVTDTRDALGSMPVPTGLAASGGDLWAADWATGTVSQLVDEGVVLDPAVQVATGLSGPEGLAVAPDGGLLVVETAAGRLSHIDLATGAVMTIVDNLHLATGSPEGMPPTWLFDGVAVGGSGAIYVSAAGIYRIDL